MYSMAESYMIPKFFSKLHPKYKTPVNALYLIGALSMLAPFAGRKMLVWIWDAGNFGGCIAYCIVSVSFLVLRKREPELARPFKVKIYKFIGGMAVILSGFMVASAMNGDVSNISGQIFAGESAGSIVKAVLSVAVVTPFYFIGFDVIPQAAEEINVPLKKIGKIMILSVVLAVTFYALVILSVGYILNPLEIVTSNNGSGLVTADGMA